MKKSLSLFLALTLFIVISAILVLNTDELIYNVFSNSVDQKKTIIIDPGHGGFDGGAVASDGTPEKDINLEISKTLKCFLTHFGFDVVMTRDTDISTESASEKKNKKTSDLYNRLALMKEQEDAIYVSIHLNKFTSSSVCGAQTFYSQNADGSDVLAQSIHSNIINMLQPENTREIKKGTKSIFLLKNATCPTVIVECGFLSNNEELIKLKDENYQRMMAFCIFCGIMDYHMV